jgi:peptidyl-prolyl cis-trans isomerase A (cyclophilin A)
VISGSEVVEAISTVRTGRNDRPVDDVVLETVLIDRNGGPPESGG